MSNSNSNEIWGILGIAETKDEEAIKAAYMTLLPDFHPEDDPEGFQRLRRAYEDAVSFANAPEDDEEVPDTTESGLIVSEFKEIVADFVRRLNPSEWQAVLDRDICAGIDMKLEIGEKLLVFLMNDPYLPNEIWKLLDSFFSWSSMADFLKEKFPEGYIDYIVDIAIVNEEIVRAKYIDLSDPSLDFEGFLQDYYDLNEAVGEDELEEASRLILAHRETPYSALFSHPDYRLALSRYHIKKEEFSEADGIIEELYQAYPSDLRVLVMRGFFLVARGKPAEGLAAYEEVLAQDKDYYQAKVGVVQAHFDLGDFEEAKSRALDMLTDYPFDGNVSSLFYESSEKLIEVYEAELAKSKPKRGLFSRKENKAVPVSQELIYKLASCYFNIDKFDKCEALITKNVPDEAHAAKHAELLFDTLQDGHENYIEESEKNIATMVSLLETWEKHEGIRKRLRKLPQKYYSIGMEDKALEKAEIYLKEFPGDAEICVVQAQIFRGRDDIAGGRKAVEAGLKVKPGHPQLLAEEAYIHYSDGNIAEAVGSAEASVLAYPYNGWMWDLIIGAYFNAGQMEAVIEHVNTSEQYGITSPGFRIRRAAAQIDVGRYDWDSLKVLDDFLSEVDEDDGDKVMAQYYRGFAAYLTNDLKVAVFHLSATIASGYSPLPAYVYLCKSYMDMGEIEGAIKAIDDAVSYITDDNEYFDEGTLRSLLAIKLDAYHRNNLYAEALSLESSVLDENGETDDSDVYINLGYCHYEHGEDDIAEAFFEKAVALDPDSEEVLRKYGNFLRRGRKDLPAAIERYKAAIEAEPFHSAYNRLGQAYDEVGDTELAKACYAEAEKLIMKYLETRQVPCLYYSLGEALFGLGDYTRAEEALAKAMDTAGDYISCHTHFCYEAAFVLALLHRAKGDMATARKYYGMALDVTSDREYVEQAGLFE
ncbi:MAG: tetratricopeptide repeat protein [Clostridiales Family XIII bacterium]|jgi:tetratricopeptide (TPR) repeat protein|nr:tetratricopeptide repeat protein [Clostridiales Family XIII bacterium]